MSDIHGDSPGHDKALFTRDMDKLAAENARILFNGDVFDAIMPTDRKRYSRSGDKMEQDAQINERVDFIAEKLKPYADFIDYLGYGNHEVTVIKYNNVDPMAMLQRELNKSRSPKLYPIQRGGYCGFIYLHFHRNGDRVKRQIIYRTHGVGGNAPVTKGIISLNRLYGTYDSDIYWIGHSHTSVIDPASQWAIGVSPQGNLYRKNKIGIITPGYQRNFDEEEYGDSNYYKLDFPQERFLAPTGIGYGRLEVEICGDDIRSKVSIE
jgi:hypothetical protein